MGDHESKCKDVGGEPCVAVLCSLISGFLAGAK